MSFSVRTALLLSAVSLLTMSALVDADPAAAPVKPPVTAPDKAPHKDFPDQSTVASKAAFGTVAASDSAVKSALDAKGLAAALKLVGKAGSFQGTVSKVYSPKNHGFVALDFAPNYHDALTANIAPEDYAKFPDLAQLQGKHVLVSGKFVAHGDATQLAVSSADQIKIIP